MTIHSEKIHNIRSQFTCTAEHIHHYPFHVNKHLKILYVLEGSIKITNVSGSVILNKNHIECINVFEPAEITSLTSHNKVLVLEIKNEFLHHIDSNINNMILNVGAIQFFPTSERHTTKENKINSEKLKQMFLNLFWNAAMDSHSESTFQNLEGLCKFLIDHFDDVKKHLHCFSPMNEQMIERFRRIDYYIQENLSKRMKLDDLVELEFLSPQYLSSEIKEKYRRTFLNIIEYYRTIKAVRLMIGNHSIKAYELIQRCGFSNSKYFYRAFKNHMGNTPEGFRQYLIRSGGTAQTTFLDIKSEHLLIHVRQGIHDFRIHDSFNFNSNIKHLAFASLDAKYYPASQLQYFKNNIQWKECQPGYYNSDVNQENFLHQYYSIFTMKNTLSIEIVQDEVWFYHSGDSLHLELERNGEKRERINAILTAVEKGMRTPVFSLLKGDIVHVNVSDPMNGTLISRVSYR